MEHQSRQRLKQIEGIAKDCKSTSEKRRIQQIKDRWTEFPIVVKKKALPAHLAAGEARKAGKAAVLKQQQEDCRTVIRPEVKKALATLEGLKKKYPNFHLACRGMPELRSPVMRGLFQTPSSRRR
uniref:Uncharacterized protein n=1 Tax=Magnetococcus massalia (strain MO-1) TaxID=451514 RepID=A0A1S7LG66_MAGMO|nr:protein of unknown function [Candidatus Magnetococcus massalia]